MGELNIMDLIRINKNQTQSIARLLTNCFMDDPLVNMQVKGIDNKKLFLEN